MLDTTTLWLEQDKKGEMVASADLDNSFSCYLQQEKWRAFLQRIVVQKTICPLLQCLRLFSFFFWLLGCSTPLVSHRTPTRWGALSHFLPRPDFSPFWNKHRMQEKKVKILCIFLCVRKKRFQLVVSSPIISDCQREGNKTLEHFHSGGQRPPAASLVSR